MTVPTSRKPASLFAAALLLIVLSGALWAQVLPPGQASAPVPPQLKPPEGTKLILHARGVGDQVYTCKQDVSNSNYSWTFKEPKAQLFDEGGKLIGTHFAGPSWQLNDTSQVTGRVVAHVAPSDPDAIPWLLLSAGDHFGSGLMEHVSDIQRLNTSGGKAPATGCDAAHVGAETKVSYNADYYFLGK